MVVKTELCVFSEWKIYPGRGVRYVAKDGRPFLYLSKRSRCFGLRKVKAQRLRWTTAWRRLHKKSKQTEARRAKREKVFKMERAIEGVTLDNIKKMKNSDQKTKKAMAEEAVREIKERQKVLAAKKQNERKAVNKGRTTQEKAQEKVAQKAQKKVKKNK